MLAAFLRNSPERLHEILIEATGFNSSLQPNNKKKERIKAITIVKGLKAGISFQIMTDSKHHLMCSILPCLTSKMK